MSAQPQCPICCAFIARGSAECRRCRSRFSVPEVRAVCGAPATRGNEYVATCDEHDTTELQRCAGCDEPRATQAWRVTYRDGSAGSARYCRACGRIAAAGTDTIAAAELDSRAAT